LIAEALGVLSPTPLSDAPPSCDLGPIERAKVSVTITALVRLARALCIDLMKLPAFDRHVLPEANLNLTARAIRENGTAYCSS
jgi:hypothetical protein